MTGVRASYDRARTAVLAATEFQVDEIFLLEHAARGSTDHELLAHVSKAKANLRNDPYARLIDPSIKPRPIETNLPQGVARLGAYMLAAFAEPDHLALERLTKFASRTENGYALSHQVLALAWYEATGRQLTDELMTRRTELLAAIEREQLADSHASDLFAERASTLIMYGTPSRSEMQRWVDALVAAQAADGTWNSHPITFTYAGETVEAPSRAMHTVAHAMFVLRRFLDTPR